MPGPEFACYVNCMSDEMTQQAMTDDWPELTGSPKQVTWAEDIRRDGIAKIGRHYHDPALRDLLIAALQRQVDAKWWIDTRHLWSRGPLDPTRIRRKVLTPEEREEHERLRELPDSAGFSIYEPRPASPPGTPFPERSTAMINRQGKAAPVTVTAVDGDRRVVMVTLTGQRWRFEWYPLAALLPRDDETMRRIAAGEVPDAGIGRVADTDERGVPIP